MSEKACPLLTLAAPPIGTPAFCLGERCAWWVPVASEKDGRCAVADLACGIYIAES